MRGRKRDTIIYDLNGRKGGTQISKTVHQMNIEENIKFCVVQT